MSEPDLGPDYQLYLLPLLRNWRWVLGATLVGALLAVGAAMVAPRAYEGTVTFFVSTPSSSGNSQLAAGQFGQERVRTYARLLNSDRLGSLVQKDANLPYSGREVAKKVVGDSDPNTVLLTATIADPDRDRALKMVNSLAQRMPALVAEIEGKDDKGLERVKLVVVSGPSVAGEAAGPSPIRLGVFGGLAGLIVGMIVAFTPRGALRKGTRARPTSD